MEQHEPLEQITQTKRPWSAPQMVAVDIAEMTEGSWKAGSDSPGATSTLS